MSIRMTMSRDFGKSSPTQRSLYPKMKAHQSCPALPGPQQLALHAPLLRGVERQRGEGKTPVTAARVEKDVSTPAESTSTGAISAPSAGTPMVCVFFLVSISQLLGKSVHERAFMRGMLPASRTALPLETTAAVGLTTASSSNLSVDDGSSPVLTVNITTAVGQS